MLYIPDPTLINPYAVAGQTVVATFVRYAADYTRDDTQPWAYYIGYGLGSAAMATGLEGSAAVIYAIAEGAEAAVRIYLETSPGAAEVAVFLDGVADSVRDLNAVEGVLDFVLNIPNDGQQHAISLLNLGAAVGVSNPTNWMSILQLEATSATIVQGVPPAMPTFLISATIQDAKAAGSARVRNVQTASIQIQGETLTLADVQAYHDAYITALDAVTEGKIIGSNVTLNYDLPAGLKATAVAGSDVQEGGLLTFSMVNTTYKESVRIPAFLGAAFTGATINIAQANVVALRDLLNGTTQVNGKTIKASNRFGFALDSLLEGSKSFRK